MDNEVHSGKKSTRPDNHASFNYVYTCDIEDALFRVKIVNLDGILPPSPRSSDSYDSGKQSSLSSPKKSPNYATAVVQNHYSYNIVDILEELSLVDELVSDEEDDSGNSSNSKLLSDNSINLSKKSFLHSSSTEKYSTEHVRSPKQSKSQKLSQTIFGYLNQPFRALSPHPFISCDLISNGQRLCPPQQSLYRQMTTRYQWNEWLVFSLTLDTLPRDTRVCFTLWDTIGPGKMAAVARTSISLFSTHGCMRKGLYDLRLYFNEDCEDYYNSCHNNKDRHLNELNNLSETSDQITAADIDFSSRNHRNRELLISEKNVMLKNQNSSKSSNNQAKKKRCKTKNFDPTSIQFTSTTQYLQSNLANYPDGNCALTPKIKQLNKLKKKYYNGQISKLDWLDRLTFLKIERIMVNEKSSSTFVFLTVEFPTILLNGIEHHAVYYEDKDEQCCQYDIIEKEIVTVPDPEINLPNLVELKHHSLARSARSGISLRDHKPNAATRNQLNAIVNYPSTRPLTSKEQDLIWKFRFYLCNQKKALTKFLKTVNWNSSSEVEQAINLMMEWTPMDIEDALELLSPHFIHPAVRRYAVSRLKEAADEDLLLYLLQLVQALKYENFFDIKLSLEAELHEYEKMQQNSSEANSSSTKDLKKMFSNSPHITAETFLVESMKIFSSSPSSNDHGEASNSQQSNNHSEKTSDSNNTKIKPDLSDTQKLYQNKYGEDLATFLINRACSNDELANYFFWYLMVECEGAKSMASSASSIDKSNPTPYTSVITSAVTASYLIPPPPPFSANSESEDSKLYQLSNDMATNMAPNSNNVIDMYLIMMKRFSARLLKGTPAMVKRRKFLLRQQDFVVKLVEIMKDVARESGNRTKKIEKLQAILASPEPRHRFNFSIHDPLPLPLNPNVKIVGVVSKEATLFKSAMMPAKLGFLTDIGSVYFTIFKHGDDLRQDDLVLQMIILMDKLLRMENLDLKLTPYRVLACSSKHGFVQYIDSQSVAEVLSVENSIQNYLRKISINLPSLPPSQTVMKADIPFGLGQQRQQSANMLSTSPNSQTPLSSASSSSSLSSIPISPEVMDAYIKSCAGYCVITYLLGVGDRHLDNLMLTKTGRLFHIDFGFILGRDPKVRPPPMKITREMVDAMGGMNSDNFSKFCNLVRTAFLHLRRHANLILNLFSLMVDANVPDIALEPDKTVQKVQDKFKLELNDEQADHHITEQVEQSVRSIMPVVVDQLHKMTQYLRN